MAKKIRLFVEPSDSLFISFDANDLKQGKDFRRIISFSGRNKSANEMMQKYSCYKNTPEFIPGCKDKTVKQYLTELHQHVKIENDELGVFVREQNPPETFIHWATWCGPCRAEMPSMIELYEKLKNGSIAFISVCCNSDRHTWKLLVSENKLLGEHFYLDKSQTEIFRSKLKLPGFPTYIIIKDGKIENNNAPRPGSGKVEKLLSELSNQYNEINLYSRGIFIGNKTKND